VAVHLTVKPARFHALAKRINGLQEPLMIVWSDRASPRTPGGHHRHPGRRLRQNAALPPTDSARRSAMNKELFERGLRTRREVLGADHVDASLRNADEFSLPMQELTTQYCWGDIWNRPGLDRRTRSFLNLAMLTALNRPHELKLHVRAAITNGLTKDEIGEALLQAAVYCGVPAGIDAFRVAREAFKEMGI
jgi:4-carboxymuconolactone decarboxylase